LAVLLFCFVRAGIGFLASRKVNQMFHFKGRPTVLQGVPATCAGHPC
jgi:hypothetical protein